MERATVLEFPTHQRRRDFIGAVALAGYTLHKENLVLYGNLSKPEIQRAIDDFGAKDISYRPSDGSFFYWFLEILGAAFNL